MSLDQTLADRWLGDLGITSGRRVNEVQVVFQHVLYEPSGFGTAAREIAFAMEDLGVDVKLEVMGGGRSNHLSASTLRRLERMQQKPLNNDRLLLALHPVGSPGTYRKVISCTMFETSKAPPSYVSICNQCDAVIVPSEMNRQLFRDGGVTVPIYVAHYGVDSRLFTPEGPARELGRSTGQFVFLSIFGWSDRKGPDILIQAFLREFNATDPVRLVLKTHGGNIAQLPSEWYERIARQIDNPSPPDVQIIADDLSPEEVAMLYRGSDCFVLPSRGEAIGLPYLESMASGLPVIATGWGGHITFLGPQSGYLLPYRLVPAHPVWYTDLYQPDQLWAEADVGALQNVMRRVYLQRDEAKRKGQHGRQVAEGWNWRRTGVEFVQAIEAIVGQSIRQK